METKRKYKKILLELLKQKEKEKKIQKQRFRVTVGILLIAVFILFHFKFSNSNSVVFDYDTEENSITQAVKIQQEYQVGQLRLAQIEIEKQAQPTPVKNKDIKVFNAYVISEMDAENINKKLVGTYLEGMGDVLYDIEQNKGVNFRVIYAIGALESGYGKYTANTYNYFGIKNGSGKGYRAFGSKREALYYISNLLNHSMYKGKSLDDIGKIYCPPDNKWSYKVRLIMNEI